MTTKKYYRSVLLGIAWTTVIACALVIVLWSVAAMGWCSCSSDFPGDVHATFDVVGLRLYNDDSYYNGSIIGMTDGKSERGPIMKRIDVLGFHRVIIESPDGTRWWTVTVNPLIFFGIACADGVAIAVMRIRSRRLVRATQ